MKKSLLIISLLLGHFLSFAQIDYTRGIPVLPNLQFGSREASICNAG